MRCLDKIQKKLEFRDKKSIQGYVKVKVNEVPYWEGPNLIMNEGLAYAAKLLGGFATVDPGGTFYETIDRMLIGNGGCDTVPAPSGLPGLVATPATPVPPQRTDATTNSQALNSQINTASPHGDTGSVQAANTVIFQASFQADSLVNGDFPEYGTIGASALFVNEFGLYVSSPLAATPQLLARVCVPSIAFAPTSGWTIAVEWTVGYL